MGRERDGCKTTGINVHDRSNEKYVLGCSSTTSNTALRAELLIGIYPPTDITNKDARKLKWQYKVRNIPEKGLPAMHS